MLIRGRLEFVENFMFAAAYIVTADGQQLADIAGRIASSLMDSRV
jgi:hypothetical protein